MIIKSFNPNKVGFFERSFFWRRGQFDLSTFKFYEDLIWYQYNFIQLLNNLLKVYLKTKNADIISYKLVPLVFYNKESSKNPKTWWQLMKIANIDTERESSYLLNNSRNFNETFRKNVTYDNIKSHKKSEFHPLFRRYIFEKTTGCVKLTHTPSLFVVEKIDIYDLKDFYQVHFL